MIDIEKAQIQNRQSGDTPAGRPVTPLEEEHVFFRGVSSSVDPEYIEVPFDDPNIYVTSDMEEVVGPNRDAAIANELLKVDEYITIKVRAEIAAHLYLNNEASINLMEIRDTIVVPEFVKVAQEYKNTDLVEEVSEGLSAYVRQMLSDPSSEMIDGKVSEYTHAAKAAALIEVIDHIEEQLATVDPLASNYSDTKAAYEAKVAALEKELMSMVDTHADNEREREVSAILEGREQSDPVKKEKTAKAWYSKNGAAAHAIKSVLTR